MNSRFLKVSIIFTFLTLVGKILSFLKEMIIASQFGISAQTDAFNLALSIPNILYSVCASAILITFIPNFYEVEKEDGLDGAYNFSNVFLTFLLLINSSVLIICNLFSEEIVKMIGPGLDYETQVLANSLIKVSLFNLMFMVISSVYSAILRSKEKFIGVSLMVIITNIPLIIMLTIFKYKISIEVVNFLTTIGFCLQFVILLPEMRKIKYKFEFIFNGYKKRIFYMIKAMIPITIGLSVVQISQVVDKIIGSTLDVGSITSIELSNKIIMIIYGILSSCIITIFSPILSKKFLCEDKSEWIKVIQGLSKYMIILLVPISFGCIILSSDLVSVIYGRGNFSNNDINFVAMAFLGNVIQLPFLAIREIIGQGFYSTKNTIVPAINGGIAVIINIILTIIFSNLWGVFGITLGTSISTILGAILLLKSFKNKYDVFNLVDIIKCFTKVIISSLFMSLIVWIIRLTLVDVVGEFMVIVLSILIGGLSYFAFSLILKINEVKELTYYLLKNVRR